MSICPRVFLVMLFFACPGLVQAQDPPATSCLLGGPTYYLASDTVQWSMAIASGQTCVRGLRANNTVLDNIELITPPKAGQVRLQGPAFTYKADPDFQGTDSFAFSVSGRINKMTGSSTIQILVSVRP